MSLAPLVSAFQGGIRCRNARTRTSVVDSPPLARCFVRVASLPEDVKEQVEDPDSRCHIYLLFFCIRNSITMAATSENRDPCFVLIDIQRVILFTSDLAVHTEHHMDTEY
jgi:hypothetical protein